MASIELEAIVSFSWSFGIKSVFSFNEMKWIIAQIVLGMEYVHCRNLLNGIIYDIIFDNLLIDHNGYIAIQSYYNIEQFTKRLVE